MLVFRFDAPGDENVTPLEGISGPGDSGGPAFLETADGLRLAGLSVASSGRPKGRYGVWEFYTRVSPQVQWVWDTTSTEYVESDLPARSVSAGEVTIVTTRSVPTGEVTIVTTRSVPAGEVETIAMPGSVSAGELGPIVIRRSEPAGEVEPVATPGAVPAIEVEPEGSSGFGAAVYTGVAILGGLALTAFAWWFRRRQPSMLE